MKKNHIKISIVMPLFNPRHDHLNECINSLLDQDFKDFELIVVDDSYKNVDNNKLFKSFPNERLQYFRNENPLGLQASLNFGIKNAKGKFIARMDGDDISQKDRLLKQINFLEENPHISIVGSNCITIDAKGNTVGGRIYPLKKERYSKFIFNPLAHPSVMFQKDFFDKFGFYNLKY